MVLFAACTLVFGGALQTGCSTTPHLEAGGVYTDIVLAKTDQTILDASHTMAGFVQWQSANAAYLAKWPAVGELANRISAQKDGWIRNAYAARDSYALALLAYREAVAASKDKSGPAVDEARAKQVAARAKLDGAIALLNDIADQIIQFRTDHSHA